MRTKEKTRKKVLSIWGWFSFFFFFFAGMKMGQNFFREQKMCQFSELKDSFNLIIQKNFFSAAAKMMISLTVRKIESKRKIKDLNQV